MNTKSRKRKQFNRLKKNKVRGKACYFDVDPSVHTKGMHDMQKRVLEGIGIPSKFFTTIYPTGFTLLDRDSEEARNHKEYHNWNNNENKEQIK